MSSKAKPLALAIAQLVAGGAFSALVAAPAIAQAPPTQAGVVGRIDVTGTNIRRTDSETPSEVQVITKEQMVQSGYTTVSQVLRDLTANGTGTLSQSFNRAFAGGGSGVALRSLTVGSTLVLIDGYRMAGFPTADDNQRNFVDISSIPFVAVDRIEVLLDGASAIYGSDAIAGVVNVILKKDFKGTYAFGSGGTTTKGGGTTWDGQLMQGFGDVGAGLGGYAAFEYREQDAIRLNQRNGERWNVTDYSSWGGPNLNPGASSGLIPLPAIANAPYLQKPGAASGSPSSFAFLNSNCDFTRLKANQCQYDNSWGQIQPHTQNVNLILSVTGKLANDWMLNVTGSYFNSQGEQNVQPQLVSAGSFPGVTSMGPNQTPSIKNAIPVYTVPATYPGNPFGVPANVRGILAGINPTTTSIETGTSRLVAQLTGSAWGWDIIGAAGYTNVRQNTTFSNYINPIALLAALNDPVHPYLLTGPNDASVQNGVAPKIVSERWNALSFAQASGSRDLMQLEGGPLSFAIGAGDVYKNLQLPGTGPVWDGITRAGGGASAYAVGSQNNANIYAEIVAPVLKNVEIDAALRYDHYNTPNANTWNPKIGVKWTPIQQLALRGTAGTGFRAPWVTEAGNSGKLFNLAAIRDPLLCPDLNADGKPNLNSPNNVVATPNGLNTCSAQFAYLGVGNPNLKPEKSDNATAGFVVEPIKGWSTTFDYYYIKLKNQIVNSSSLVDFNPIDSATRGIQQQVTFGDGHTGLSSVGPIQYITAPYVNANSLVTTGFDLSTGYTWALPDSSKLLTSVTWTHIISWDLTVGGIKYKVAGTHGVTDYSGDTGTPKDRAQFILQWAKGPFTATANINYIGRFNVTSPSEGASTCADGLNRNNARWATVDVPPAYCDVASFTYVDLNFQYALNKQWTLQASILNAFNAKPPYDFETYGGLSGGTPNLSNGVPYNPSLHQTGASGPFWSLGFIYNFN